MCIRDLLQGPWTQTDDLAEQGVSRDHVVGDGSRCFDRLVGEREISCRGTQRWNVVILVVVVDEVRNVSVGYLADQIENRLTAGCGLGIEITRVMSAGLGERLDREAQSISAGPNNLTVLPTPRNQSHYDLAVATVCLHYERVDCARARVGPAISNRAGDCEAKAVLRLGVDALERIDQQVAIGKQLLEDLAVFVTVASYVC